MGFTLCLALAENHIHYKPLFWTSKGCPFDDHARRRCDNCTSPIIINFKSMRILALSFHIQSSTLFSTFIHSRSRTSIMESCFFNNDLFWSSASFLINIISFLIITALIMAFLMNSTRYRRTLNSSSLNCPKSLQTRSKSSNEQIESSNMSWHIQGSFFRLRIVHKETKFFPFDNGWNCVSLRDFLIWTICRTSIFSISTWFQRWMILYWFLDPLVIELRLDWRLMYEKAVLMQIFDHDEVKILKWSGLHRYLQGTVNQLFQLLLQQCNHQQISSNIILLKYKRKWQGIIISIYTHNIGKESIFINL